MAGKTPKYRQIRNHLLQQIEAGVLQPGDRLPVRSELIKQYAVTRTTMDKALNELIRQGVLSSSKRGGTIVSDGPQQRKRVAVVSRLSDASLARHQGMPNDLQRMFASMILCGSDRADVIFLDEEQVRKELNQIRDYDHCIWVQPEDAIFEQLEKYHEHVTITNRYVDDLHYVSTNHRAAIREVTEAYINALGNDVDLFYIASAHDFFIKQERGEGFKEACTAHGLSFHSCEIECNDEAVDTLMSLPINAERTSIIVTMSSIHEPAILAMAQKRGLIRGEHYYYADCDNDNIAQGHRPAAITITQDYPKMGEVAMQAAIDGEATQAFIPHIIKGDVRFL